MARGGLIQLSALNSESLHLTESPQITYFKTVFRRYTPFAIENIEVGIEDKLEFGERSYVPIPGTGDLLMGSYLQIEIPELYFTTSEAGFNNSIGIANSIVTELDTVRKYMDLNVEAYKNAVENYEAINVGSTTMIDNILSVYNTGDGSIIVAYESIISNNSEYYFFGSNIKLFIENIQFSNKQYTKDEILNICKVGIDNSVLALQEYNRRYQKYLADNEQVESTYVKSAWVDRLGYSILKEIEFVIGGETIEKKIGVWMDIKNKASGNYELTPVLQKMIGDVDDLKRFDRKPKPRYILRIPLDFWFHNVAAQAFPLCSIRDIDVGIYIELRDFMDCVYIEKPVNFIGNIPLDDIWNDRVGSLNASLLIDYVFLDEQERRKFIVSSHEYLIDRVQTNSFRDIEWEKVKVDLDFRNPCKELFWFAQREPLLINETGYDRPYPLLTSVNGKNPINRSSLFLYDSLRFEHNSDFTEFVVINNHHKNSVGDGVNCYSFSEKPELRQPTGVCNFTPIPAVSMKLRLKPELFKYRLSDVSDIYEGDDDIEFNCSAKLTICAVTVNVLRIANGYAAIAYV